MVWGLNKKIYGFRGFDGNKNFGLKGSEEENGWFFGFLENKL